MLDGNTNALNDWEQKQDAQDIAQSRFEAMVAEDLDNLSDLSDSIRALGEEWGMETLAETLIAEATE